MNRKKTQCVNEKFELQMPKFAFRTTNASKTLGTLCSNFMGERVAENCFLLRLSVRIPLKDYFFAT